MDDLRLTCVRLLERHIDATAVIDRTRVQTAESEGIQLYLQPRTDLPSTDRASRNQFQYTLEDSDQTELHVDRKDGSELRKQPELRGMSLPINNLRASRESRHRFVPQPRAP